MRNTQRQAFFSHVLGQWQIFVPPTSFASSTTRLKLTVIANLQPVSLTDSDRLRNQPSELFCDFRRPSDSQQSVPFSSPRNPNLSPLCFHGLTNCFSRNSFPLINICVAPRVWGAACNFLVTHRRPLRPLTPFAATHAKVMHASPFPATHPKKQGVAMIIVNQTTAHLTSKDGQRNISAQRCTLASPTSYET